MQNSTGLLSTKLTFPHINVTKVIIVINLWIFLFIQFFVLVPVTAYAATASKMTDVKYTQVFKTGEVYTTTVTVNGTGTVGITNLKSKLGRQVVAPKSVKLPGSFEMEIKCGDVINVTVDGVEKEIKSPACTKEVSSCENPVGWIESTKDTTTSASGIPAISSPTKTTKGENYTTYYFAKDKKNILATDDLQNSPDKFTGIICLGTSKQNYEKDGKFEKIDNKIIKKTTGRFEYVSTGNDYQAYFTKEAKDGFKFTTSPVKSDTGEVTPGATIEVVKVLVAGKELKTPKPASISGNTITYYSVLPDVDLVYQLDNTGVTKQFVLRSQDALKNNLSKIEFQLSGAELKKETQAKVVIDKKLVDGKVDKKSTSLTEIKKQKTTVDSLLPAATPATLKVQDKALNELAGAKSTELAKLVKAVENKENVDVASELDRIDNLPVSDESVTMKNEKDSIRIDLPISYSQNDSSLLKAESVNVSADGKTLIILPDVSALKKLDKKAFPYIIDPRWSGQKQPAEDTYIGNDGTRVASRGYQRSMTVGARPEGGVAAVYLDGYNGSIGDAAAFIKFDVPSEVTSANISSAQLILRQYGTWNTGGFTAQIIKTGWFSESSLTYYDNRPPEYGVYGTINFSNVNTSAAGNFLNAWSTDISQIIREGNRQVYLKVMDSQATSRSATFCSKDGNIYGHPCNQSWNGPLLEIYLKADPSAPVAVSPNSDIVAGCTGENCAMKTTVTNQVRNFWDGYQMIVGMSCTPSNLVYMRYESSNYTTAWNSPDWSKVWSQVNKNISDYGTQCGDWATLNFNEIKQNGTYSYDHYLYSISDTSVSKPTTITSYTVDSSAPIVAKNTNVLPKAIKNDYIEFQVPTFFDDSKDVVYFENINGGIIDATSSAGTNLTGVVNTSVSSWTSTPSQKFVIESGGLFRSLINGRCLNALGGNMSLSTSPCNTTENINGAYMQRFSYLVDTKQITMIQSSSLCLAKEGTSLMLRTCDVNSIAQKWDMKRVQDVATWSSVNPTNKTLAYNAYAKNTADGSIINNGNWSSSTIAKVSSSVSGLKNGQTYNIFVRAKDRISGTANTSKDYLMGTVSVDTEAPLIQNPQIVGGNKQFSPNNSTSIGKFDTITYTYEYKDANPYSAHLDIIDSSKQLVARLGHDSSKDTTGQPILTPNIWRKYTFTWDGKYTEGVYKGQFAPEGIYTVNVVAVDKTCEGVSWIDSSKCNLTNSVVSSLTTNLDNTPSQVSVTTPGYEIWTNNINYEMTGSVAYSPVVGKMDTDANSFYINGTLVSFDNLKNYKYRTNLVEGRNVFTVKSVDEAANVNTTAFYSDVGYKNEVVVNLDTTTPKILSVIDVTPSNTIKSSKSLKITFTDPLNANIASGANLNSLDVRLFNSSKDKVGSFVESLIYNGAKPTISTKLQNFSCTQTECTLNLVGLSDGYYQLFIGLQDKTLNQACTFIVTPYDCKELANFEKILQVGTPVDGNLVGSDTDTTKALTAVNIFPTYDGLNSADTLSKIANNTLLVTDSTVQKMVVRVNVSQGTDAVDLDFTYDTAIDPKHIATINSTMDIRKAYPGYQANMSTLAYPLSNISANKCSMVECVWEYAIVYDSRFVGGTPKINITAYKNGNIERVEKKWDIFGQIKGDPKVITFDKVDASGNISNANFYSGIYYTNQINNKIQFATNPGLDYVITFRNGTNSFTKMFKADQYGSTILDVPVSIDGTWDVLYNNVVFQKFVLDRAAPTVVKVLTKDTYNAQAVNPFVRLGDNVEFQIESNEALWDSGLLSDVASRYYSEKVVAGCEKYKSYELQYLMGSTVCNEAWRNAKVQKVNYIVKNINPANLIAEEGIQSPVITLTDYAGNTAKVNSTGTGASYSPTARSWSTDWRLFIDSTVPDKQNIDTNIWKDGKDGVSADGITPEVDRLPVTPISPTGEVARWVIRGNAITLKLRGEKYTKALIEGQIVNATNSNCNVVGTPVTKNNLIVKSNEVCDLSYTYTWTGTGAQDEYGQANDQKTFRYNLMDLAGNYSATSDGVTIYNDRTATQNHTLTLSSTDDSKQVNSNATNATTVKVTDRGERLSDVNYQVVAPKGATISRTQKFGTTTDSAGIKTGDMKINQCFTVGCTVGTETDLYASETKVNLGTQTDDRLGCTQTNITGRRVGICEDGNYTIQTRLFDTSGNATGWITKQIERDTVSPFAPKVSLAENGGIVATLSSAGEPNSSYFINGVFAGILDGSGNATYKIISRYEYSTYYSFNITVSDTAGNMSPVTVATITTKAAPIRLNACSVSSQGLYYPGATVYPKSSGFDYTREVIVTPNGPTQKGHDGLDLAFPPNTEVLAAQDGLLTRGTDQYGGKFVIITKGNLQTLYWHLSEIAIANNIEVTHGQLIGYSGDTGLAKGFHLHFGVRVNGVLVDPEPMLNCGSTSGTSNNGNQVNISALDATLNKYCIDEEEQYDMQCLADYPIALLLYSRTGNEYQKWSDENKLIYTNLSDGMKQYIIDEKLNAISNETVAKYLDAIQNCIPDIVNNIIAYASVEYFVNYATRNPAEDLWEYTSSVSVDPLTSATVTRYGALQYNIIKVNKTTDIDKAKIKEGADQGLQEMYLSCGVDYFGLLDSINKMDADKIQTFTSMNKRIEDWVYTKMPSEVKVYTGTWRPQSTDKNGPIMYSNTPTIVESMWFKYSINEVIDKKPKVDVWAGAMLGGAVLGAGIGCATSFTGLGLLACSGAITIASAYGNQLLISKITDKPFDMNAFKFDVAVGLILLPLDLLTTGMPESSLAKMFTVKFAEHEINIIAQRGPKVLLNGMISEATERMVVRGASHEFVGYLADKVVLDSTRSKVLSNIYLNSANEIFDSTRPGELLSVVAGKNMLVTVISKESITTFNSRAEKFLIESGIDTSLYKDMKQAIHANSGDFKFDIKTNQISKTGGGHYAAARKAMWGALTQWTEGKYGVKQGTLDYYGVIKSAATHTEYPDVTAQQLNTFRKEMYSNSKYVTDKLINKGSTNMWEGVVTSEGPYKGMKIRWYNDSIDPSKIKGAIKSDWPVFEK